MADANPTLEVQVVSPERVLYQGHAEMVVCRTADGGRSFLPGHVPLLGSLGIAKVRAPPPGSAEQVVAVHGGFVEVSHNRVIVLSDVAELPEQIDVGARRSRPRPRAGRPRRRRDRRGGARRPRRGRAAPGRRRRHHPLSGPASGAGPPRPARRHRRVALVALLVACGVGAAACSSLATPSVVDTAPYRGLGTWVSVFDYVPAFVQVLGPPPVVPATLDDLAKLGVHTLYLQATIDDPRAAGLIADPPLLRDDAATRPRRRAGRRRLVLPAARRPDPRRGAPRRHPRLPRRRAALRRRRRHRVRAGRQPHRPQPPPRGARPARPVPGREPARRRDRVPGRAARGGQPEPVARVPVPGARPVDRRVAAHDLLDAAHRPVPRTRSPTPTRASRALRADLTTPTPRSCPSAGRRGRARPATSTGSRSPCSVTGCSAAPSTT